MDEWTEVKEYLKQFNNNGKQIINDAIANNPDQVKYIRKKDIEYWCWDFFYKGFECCVEYQVSDHGNDKYRLIAFDHRKSVTKIRSNTVFIREPLLENL